MKPELRAILEARGGRIHELSYGGRSGAELLGLLEASGQRLNEYARLLLGSAGLPASPAASPARVLELAVADLGFPEGAAMAELRARAAELGLGEAPLDLAPALRLAYRDQEELPETERHRAPAGSLTVVSAPLREEEDFPRGFYLRVIGGEPWLRGYVSPADYLWRPLDRLAFLLME